MSLKVTQTSIPIDFNHQTDPNLIKTINLAPYSLNNLGHFKVQSSRQYLHYPYIYHEIRFCFATFQILALFNDNIILITTNFNQIHICHSGMLIRGIN